MRVSDHVPSVLIGLGVSAWLVWRARQGQAYGAKTISKTEDEILSLVEALAVDLTRQIPNLGDDEIAQLVRDDLVNHRVKDPRAFKWARAETVARLRRNHARAMAAQLAEIPTAQATAEGPTNMPVATEEDRGPYGRRPPPDRRSRWWGRGHAAQAMPRVRRFHPSSFPVRDGQDVRRHAGRRTGLASSRSSSRQTRSVARPARARSEPRGCLRSACPPGRRPRDGTRLRSSAPPRHRRS